MPVKVAPSFLPVMEQLGGNRLLQSLWQEWSR